MSYSIRPSRIMMRDGTFSTAFFTFWLSKFALEINYRNEIIRSNAFRKLAREVVCFLYLQSIELRPALILMITTWKGGGFFTNLLLFFWLIGKYQCICCYLIKILDNLLVGLLISSHVFNTFLNLIDPPYIYPDPLKAIEFIAPYQSNT